MRRARCLGMGFVWAALAPVAGCSSSSDSGLFGGKSAAGGATSDAGNEAGGAGAESSSGGLANGGGTTGGGGGTSGVGGDGTAGVSGGTGTGGGGDGTCTTAVSAERLPPDLFILLDTSGSMNETVGSSASQTKWNVVSRVLTDFLKAPVNAGTAIGLNYFPSVPAGAPATCTTTADCVTATGNWGTCSSGIILPGSGCIGCVCSLTDGCQVVNYAKPNVPLALPPDPSAILASIAARQPGGGTPTRPALEATLAYSESWRKQHPERSLAVLLITDGDPTGCTTNTIADVATLAASAFNGADHLKTFVVGVGSSLTSLNQVAVSGGTKAAYVLDTTTDVSQTFKTALEDIRAQATGCTYVLPSLTPSLSGSFDVTFTSGTGGKVRIPRTSDGTAATCVAGAGWYPTSPASQASIELCPASCASVNGGSLEIPGTCGGK